MLKVSETAASLERKGEWSPYENNGGTVVGVAGKDFCIIAGDTRMSKGYSIETRTGKKVLQLTDKCCITTSGMQADMEALHKLLNYHLSLYRHAHHKQMSTSAIAQLLSTQLYYKRFFPYYCFNVLGGLNEKGEGVVYSYDAVGSFEEVKYSSSGTGQQLLQPLFDNVLGWKNMKATVKADLSCEETLDLLKDAFTSAGERDIYTGDFVDIMVITKAGVKHERFNLKFD